jgi:glycosyltransferase involved in cell wall biosynthesis
MRIAFYCDGWTVGGAEVSLAHLVGALSTRIEPVVIGVDERVVARVAAERPGTRTIVLPRVRSSFDLAAIRAHVRTIRGLRADILHVSLSSPWESKWAILPALVTRGTRVIAVEKAPQPLDTARRRVFKRLVSRFVAVHVTVSPPMASVVAANAGIRPEAVRVIPSGAPDVVLEPLPRTIDGFVVGTLGRLEPDKGKDVLVRALTRLPEHVHAVVVGEGSTRDELALLASELGVAHRLHLENWRDDARRWLTTFDAYVQPSRLEALSLALTEAMLAGLPVIAAQVGGMPYVVDEGAAGLLVPPDDPDALAAAILRLADDPALRASLGHVARARAERMFTTAAMSTAFEQVYDEVMGGRADRPEPARVVFYCDTWETGGAEANLRNLTTALGSRVTPAIVATDPVVGAYLAEGRRDAELVVLPRIASRRDVSGILRHGRALRRLRPQIVHVSLNEPWSSHWGILLARLSGARVVAVENLARPGSTKQRRVKRLTTRLLAAHVAVGERCADEVAAFASVPRPRVIPNGVPDVELEPLPRPAHGPIVGSIGRLDRQKGYDVLVEALPRLPGVTAVVVGEGAERGQLTRRAAELGVEERLLLPGWSDDARRALTTFDVFVLPSRFEGLPLVLIEALLAGVPVVATRVGSIDELVTEETGILVEPEDPAALAAAIQALLDDPARRAELGANGRRRALDGFTVERVADSFAALYAEIVPSGGGATV